MDGNKSSGVMRALNDWLNFKRSDNFSIQKASLSPMA
jgi:hypothetical protein